MFILSGHFICKVLGFSSFIYPGNLAVGRYHVPLASLCRSDFTPRILEYVLVMPEIVPLNSQPNFSAFFVVVVIIVIAVVVTVVVTVIVFVVLSFVASLGLQTGRALADPLSGAHLLLMPLRWVRYSCC
jgi:hypothetical protein